MHNAKVPAITATHNNDNTMATKRDPISQKLSNNISALLMALAKDFETRGIDKCHQRGHTQIRRSHSALVSHLGQDAVRLTELADRANVSQQAMGKLVKEMESAGYVQRKVDNSDKRAKIISLTPQGEQLLSDVLEIVDEILAEYAAAMGAEGITELEQSLLQSARSLGLRTQP
jgi:DNA-binding MarR family transcriptional regulator